MNTKLAVCLLSAFLTVTPALPSTHPDKDKKEHTKENQWTGKRIAFLGDSITDSIHVGTSKCYWEYLTEWMGINPLVYAKNGNQWNGVMRQAERLKSEGIEVDAILIFAGTNDYNSNIPLGAWFDFQETETTVKGGVKEIRRKRTPQMNENTFRGRINCVMNYLKSNFPDKQIILLTPIHRAYAEFRNSNIQPEEAFPNKLGLYIDAYVNAIKESANIWAVPVIDLNSISGLYPMNDAHAHYFHNKDTDRLHPNAEGHRRIAKTLMYQLLTLPSSF